jgi:hypothetical protein
VLDAGDMLLRISSLQAMYGAKEHKEKKKCDDKFEETLTAAISKKIISVSKRPDKRASAS